VAAYTRLAEANPILYSLEMEAIRQTVRLGHPLVTTAHLALATLAMDRQLVIAEFVLAAERTAANRAGSIMAEHGVSFDTAMNTLAVMTVGGQIASAQRRRAWRSKPRNPRWTVDAAAAAERVREKTGRKAVGTSDVLAASLAESGGPAWRLLERLGVDPAAVTAEA
jgi:hypothetical protein